MAAASVKPNTLGVVLAVALGMAFFWYIFGLPSMFKSEEKINMKQLLAVSIEMAKRGGEKVKWIAEQHKLEEKSKGKTKEGKTEFVTEGDKSSHRAMVYGFNKAFPQLRVISEEHDTEPVDLKTILEPPKDNPSLSHIDGNMNVPVSEIAVWIDPLDATQEYTESLYQYVTTLVCVAVRGAPTIGVIHSPFTGETLWGYVGYGNSVTIDDAQAKDEALKKGHKIIVSRSHAGDVKEVAESAFGKDTEVIPAGGAGFKTREVIRKNVNAYVHVTRIKKWDICAGNAIILSANGRMTTLEGRNIDYSASGSPINDNGLLATLNNHDTYLHSLKPAYDEALKKAKSKS